MVSKGRISKADFRIESAPDSRARKNKRDKGGPSSAPI